MTGRALATVLLLQVLGSLVVPVAAQTVGLALWHLALAGLLIGTATALAGPAMRALLSDIGDRVSHTLTVRALTANDFMHRVSMVFAPALGAWAVSRGWQTSLLYVEALGLAVAAGSLVLVRGRGDVDEPGSDDSVRSAVRRAPVLARTLTMSLAGGVGWFAFALGLALLGVERGRPGVLVAAGMTGYGAASLLSAMVAPLVVPRLPALPTVALAWLVFAVSCAAILPACREPWAIGAASALGGALMPLGIGANNAIIAERTRAGARRAVFQLDSALYSGGHAAGMMVGGAVIGWLGAGPTMVTVGVALAAVVVTAALVPLARSGRPVPA